MYKLSGSLPSQNVTFEKASWPLYNPYRGDKAQTDTYVDVGERTVAHVKTYTDGTSEVYLHPRD